MEAKLYKLSNEEEKSVFAVLLDVRYGVPDRKTVAAIWGDQPTIHSVGTAELDKWLPGGDLVSIDYWFEKDRLTHTGDPTKQVNDG